MLAQRWEGEPAAGTTKQETSNPRDSRDPGGTRQPMPATASSGQSVSLAASSSVDTGNPIVTSSTSATIVSGRPSRKPSTETSIHSDGSNISPAALGGAIAGTAAVAALFALLLTLFFVRRKSKRDRQRMTTTSPANSYIKELSPINTTTGRSPSSAWEDHIPQPADDATIRRRVKSLLDQTAVFVDNHFTNHPRGGTPSLAPNWDDAYGTQSPHLPGPLPSLIAIAHKPTSLIKHSLAYLLAESVDVFLPAGIIALPQALHNNTNNSSSNSSSNNNNAHQPQQHQHDGDQQDGGWRRRGTTTLSSATTTAMTQQAALSQWRRLTGYLHPAPTADATFAASRAAAFEGAAERFTAAFSPWLKEAAARPQCTGLVALFEAAADVALLLATHACAWEWDWGGASGEGRSAETGVVVVLPGLVRVTDVVGAVLRVPRQVVERERARGF